MVFFPRNTIKINPVYKYFSQAANYQSTKKHIGLGAPTLSKIAFTGILLQPHELDGVTQEVPVTFISYSFTGMQQSWSATERELYAIFAAIRKLHYMIYGGKVIIRTDHKALHDITSGTAKVQNSAASEKLRCWTYDIMALGPEIEYKRGLTNVIADSLSRLRTDKHYIYNKPLKNNKPYSPRRQSRDQYGPDSSQGSQAREQYTEAPQNPSKSQGHPQGMRQETAHQEC